MFAFYLLVLLSVAYLSLSLCEELHEGPRPGSLSEGAAREGKESPKQRARRVDEDAMDTRESTNVDRRRALYAVYGNPSTYGYGSTLGYNAYAYPYGGYNGAYGYGGYPGNTYGYPYYFFY